MRDSGEPTESMALAHTFTGFATFSINPTCIVIVLFYQNYQKPSKNNPSGMHRDV